MGGGGSFSSGVCVWGGWEPQVDIMEVSVTRRLSAQTSEEVLERMTGLRVPMNAPANVTMELDNNIQKLPKYLDYRKKGLVTEVKDQVRRPAHPTLRTGGCVSMATTQRPQRLQQERWKDATEGTRRTFG